MEVPELGSPLVVFAGNDTLYLEWNKVVLTGMKSFQEGNGIRNKKVLLDMLDIGKVDHGLSFEERDQVKNILLLY